MATNALEPTPVQHKQHERFTTKEHDYQLEYLSLDLSGNIAVSGFHSCDRTFIDLYSGNNPHSRDKLGLIYSKEFEEYSYYWLRYVSFLDKNVSKLVTCIGDKIEIIDTKNESKVLRSCKVKGKTTCLAVREGEIFIGLHGSQTVLVFNSHLKHTKNIRIKGIQDGGWPCDLQVIKDTIFVCLATWPLRALSLSVYDGSIVSEYTDTSTTGMYSDAISIAVGEEMNLVAVLWSYYSKRGIIVYSLNKAKSLLVFDVHDDVTRIRISDRDRMIITGNQWTGEIKLYDLEQLFSFEGMKKTLAYLISPEECEKLRKYFGVTEEVMRRLGAGVKNTAKRMECLLTIIEEKGHLNPYNINTLTDAVSTLGDVSRISNLKGPMEGYSLHGVTKKNLMSEMIARQKASEEERNQLSSKLEAAESKVKDHEKILDDLHGELASVIKQSKEEQKTLKEDLIDAKQQIKRMEEGKMMATVELQQLQQSSKQMESLTKEMKDNQLKYTKEKETLEQSQTESHKKMQTLTEELKQTKQSKTESDRQIETLKGELKQSKTESDRHIETLTEELKQTKQSKTESDRQIEMLTEDLKQTKQSKTESDRLIETLTKELKQTKQSKTESDRQIEILTEQLRQSKIELETTTRDLKMTKQVLKQTTQDRDNTRTELTQYQLDFAKESKALKEVLNQAKETMTEFRKRSAEDKPLVDSDGTGDEGGAILAGMQAEFGRLTVAIAEHLTLGNCLELARLFYLPASEYGTVLRISSNASPGMKILDVLKKQMVINMFDVTNLKTALAMLHLEVINHELVEPYQNEIDENLYELNKLEKWHHTWGDAFANAVKDNTARHQVRNSQISLLSDNQPEYTSQTEATAISLETEEEDSLSLIRGRHHHHYHHQLYTERSIGREGGNIQLANVFLTVPPDALHENNVIALSVMNESPFPLDREVDTARMTPLIKLEPLGLMFKKSLQLNIPHSALISEPENHDVIIYSGQITKNNEDSSGSSITWTEEKSIQRQLKKKSVTVDIQCLTFLSASLVSQPSAPPLYILRAVPFVDGVMNTNDDIILTLCFCSDNDSEYNMLLADYYTKLPLEQYSTLQLHRQPERDEDDAEFLSVTLTSVNNTYVPDADQAVKQFAVSHLCTASRVSHQFRLRKNQDVDRAAVDIVLTFSQAEITSTRIVMKSRIKDLMISPESEDLLFGSLFTAFKPYEDLKANISGMLEYDDCRKIATYFELSPAEAEKVKTDAVPGRTLIKILDEREKIMPQKLFDLYHGLKVCHLDKIARIVLEYIEKNSNKIQQEIHEKEKDKCVKGVPDGALVSQRPPQKRQRTARSSLNDQSVQTTLSSSCVSSDVHVKTLTKEGYTEHEVVEALDISRNRPVIARKVLQCLGEQFDVSPTKDYIFLHKEQYIDENGGDIYLPEANVHLSIPVGAVSKASIVSLTIMTTEQCNVPLEGRTPQLSPVIKLGQKASTLNKAVTLRIPHCAMDTEGITSTEMYMGFSSNGEEFEWMERKFHEPKPVLEGDHFQVSVQKFCAISMNVAVDFKKPLSKKFRVLPVISRNEHPTDDLTVTLWIYNDDETEHMHLLYEEINVRGKIKLHDFKRFTLKGSEKDKVVHIKSGSNKIISHANLSMQKVLASALWRNTRHAVEFHFQNREGISDISFRLELCTRWFLRTFVDVQFDVRVALSELLQKPQKYISTLLPTQDPHPAMEISFQEMVDKLSGQLNVDSCLEIAGIFRSSSDLKSRVRKSSEPGKVLFYELIQHHLITAASVSALDVALTRTGHVHLAEEVRTYRHRNATFPTTVFTLL